MVISELTAVRQSLERGFDRAIVVWNTPSNLRERERLVGSIQLGGDRHLNLAAERSEPLAGHNAPQSLAAIHRAPVFWGTFCPEWHP